MKTIHNWINKHMVISWGIISILYAVAIHFLFHWESGIKLIEAKWSAGEILTYGSTVALGLLAMWQNQRFKKENDAAQARLENLTQQANELTAISKIVEIESAKLSTIKRVIDNISKSCSPISVAGAACDPKAPPDDNRTNIYNLFYLKQTIEENLSTLCQELGIDRTNSEETYCAFIYSTIKYCECTNRLITSCIASQALTKSSIMAFFNNEFSEYSECKKQYEMNKLRFLRRREELMNQIIYKNLSVSKIKELIEKEDAYCKSEQNDE